MAEWEDAPARSSTKGGWEDAPTSKGEWEDAPAPAAAKAAPRVKPDVATAVDSNYAGAMGTSGVSMSEAEEMPTRSAPKGKSIFERGVKMDAPNVDYEKNLETMRRSGSPESVMFTPGRQLEAVDKRIAEFEKRKGAAAEKAAAKAAQERAALEQQSEEEGYGPLGLAQDIGVGLGGKGSLAALQAVTGLGELATGWIPGDEQVNPLQIGQWGKMLNKLDEQFGINFEDGQKFLTGFQTPQMQLQLKDVEATKGFFNRVKALGVNPLALTDSIVTSIPTMVVGGVGAGAVTRMWASKAAIEAERRGLTGLAAEKFITDKVRNAAIVTGHAAEGTLTAGSIADEARSKGVDWEDYVLPALAAGTGTALIGRAAGKVGAKLGIGDVEADIAARAAGFKNIGTGNTGDGLAKYVFKEMLKEGVLEEMPQSAQEQIFTNLATGRPWKEGVPEASASGLMAGAGMGGGHAITSKSLAKLEDTILRKSAEYRAMDALDREADALTKAEEEKQQGQEAPQKTADQLAVEEEMRREEEARNAPPVEETTYEGPDVPDDAFTFKPLDEAPAETDEQRADRLDAEATKKEADQEARRNNARGVAKSNFEAAIDQAGSIEYGGDVDAALEAYKQNMYDTLNEQGEEDRYAYDAADREFDRLVAEHKAQQTKQAPATPTTSTSTALVPVGNYEVVKQQIDDSGINNSGGDSAEHIREEWVDPNTNELYEGYDYYAGVEPPHSKGLNRHKKYPKELVKINNVEDVAKAEANGLKFFIAEKPAEQTPDQIQDQVRALEDERHALLSKSGRAPAKGTKKRTQWDALTDKIDTLKQQWAVATSAPAAAPAAQQQLTNEPYTIEGETRVISESKTKDDFGNPATQLAFSDGSKHVIQRLNSAESMGLPGWHDTSATPTTGSFLGNTKAEAIQELIRRAQEQRKAAPQLGNEPYTIEGETRIVDEVVGPRVAALPAPDKQRLESHYGLKAGTQEFLAKVKEDIVRYATEGAGAVSAAIRDIIKALHSGVLAAAIIFNPTHISVPEFLVHPVTITAETRQVYAELPAGLEQMSESGQQAYRTLFPVIKDQVKKENKLFTIADKPTSYTYIFNPDGTVLLRTKTLFGKAYGDFYKGNNELPQNRITPAGFFTFGLRDALRSAGEAKTAGEYDFKKVFVLDKVIDGEYSMTLFHSVWLHESDAAARARALQNEDATDSRYSFGCINVNKQTYGFLINNHLHQMDGSPVFIVPDDPANLATLLSGDKEARDGLERNTFTPPTETVVTKTEGTDATPEQVAEQEADRRKTIFKSIVESAVTAATDISIDIADYVGANMTGVNRLIQLYRDGKLSAEDFAGQMLRLQERVALVSEEKRNRVGDRQRGFGRVVKALEDAKKGGRISAETADFAIWFLSKNPALANNLGIKIAVPENKRVQAEMAGTAGFYVPFEELVRIITNKDKETGRYAETKADTAVHEILHHLERMLPSNVRRMIRKEWAKQVTAALKQAKAEKNTAKATYLEMVLLANATGSLAAYKVAEEMITTGEVPIQMYALFNPSEFWAVRGSGLLAGRYGANTRFAKVKQWMREFVHAIKSIFGFQNNHPIIKGLDAVIRGDGTFVSEEMLREGAYDVPTKQVTPKGWGVAETGPRVTNGLHPSVVEAIKNNDINGALRALAQNTSGFYSELATRLAELELPTSIAFSQGRDLVRRTIDHRTGQQQTRLFAYISRAYPDLYAKYFQNYDRSENLEKVAEGLREFDKAKYIKGPVATEYADVAHVFNKTMPGLTAPGGFYRLFDAIDLNPHPHFGTSNRVFLHEVVHAATDYLLYGEASGALTDRQQAAVAALYEMYDFAQTKLPPGEYGFTNIAEFIAEALTNKGFQDKLKTVQYKQEKTTIFNSFIRIVMRMFGKDNLASAAMSEANELFSAFRPQNIVAIGPRFSKRVRGPISKPDTWRTAESVDTSIADTVKDAAAGRMSIDDAVRDVSGALWSAGGWAVRAAMLPILPLRILKDLTRNKFPQLAGAVDIVEKMTTYRGHKLKTAEDIVQMWGKLQAEFPKQSALMGRIMIEATIRGRDPDNGVPAGAAPDALDNAWNTLRPEFKQLYTDVRDFYANSVKEMVKEMKKRAMGLPKAERQAMIRKINDQFGPGKLVAPYFPLRRFGDFWMQVGKGNFKEFYNFESASARYLAFQKRKRQLANGNALQKALVDTMRMGNGISELYNQNVATTDVLRDTQDLISGLTATNVQDLKKELNDSLNQLIYILLPQQSMRKMFINRRAIQGASSDMLRVFAHTAVHSAYQQARFKYAEGFVNNINNAKDYIDEFASPERAAVYRDFVHELEKRTATVLGVEDKSPLAQFVGGVTGTTFFFMLTAPASALLNIIGATSLTMPYIGGRYGYAKTNALMLKYLAKYTATTPKRSLVPLATGDFANASFPSIVEGSQLPPLLRRAADRFVDDGDINISMTNDIFDLGNQPSGLYTGNTNAVKKVLAALFHQAERLNREISLLTTFELAYEKYNGADKKDLRGIVERDASGNPVKYTADEAFEIAISEARDIAGMTLGDFTRQMKGRLFTLPAVNLLTQFKQYAITATYAVLRNFYLTFGAPFNKAELDDLRAQMEKDKLPQNIIDQRMQEADQMRKEIYREGRRRLAGILGMTFLYGGVAAQPFFSLGLGTLIQAAFSGGDDDDDEFFDWQNFFYNYMVNEVGGAAGAVFAKMGMSEDGAKELGKKTGAAIARGPVAVITGASLSDRVSLDLKNLWYREGKYSPDMRETVTQEMIANMGPSVGLGMNWAGAWQLASQGQYGRAFETAAPSIVSKPVTAYRLGTEGATTRGGEVVGQLYPEQFTLWELSMQAIGFQPEKLAVAQKGAIQAKTYEQKILDKKEALMNRIWLERDSADGLELALDNAREFSIKYPEVAITPKSIADSFESRNEAKAKAEAIGAKLNEKLLTRTRPMLGE